MKKGQETSVPAPLHRLEMFLERLFRVRHGLAVCLAIVLLLLEGSMSLMAFGATKVDVSMKKISSRNTKSDMDEELNVGSTLFLDLMAIIR